MFLYLWQYSYNIIGIKYNFFFVFNNSQISLAGLFGIENQDSNTARVVSRYSLRGRFGNYSLVLQAEDSGNPPLHTTSRFQVCVTDVNDNSPVFVKPPQNYTIRVLEVCILFPDIIEIF